MSARGSKSTSSRASRMWCPTFSRAHLRAVGGRRIEAILAGPISAKERGWRNTAGRGPMEPTAHRQAPTSARKTSGVTRSAPPQLRPARIALEVDVFVPDAAPQTLDKVLSGAQPRPSAGMAMASRQSTPMNASPVNCGPWSVLETIGL